MLRQRFFRRTIIRACISLTAAVGPACAQARLQTAIPPASDPPEVLLQVVNTHFTIGKMIPSLYLRLLSDGTIECHAVNGNGTDATKKGRLTQEELIETKSLLNGSEIGRLERRYKIPRLFFDSWMEWDVSINSSRSRALDVTVSFGGGSGQTEIPGALRALSCLIIKLRHSVYGDETYYYLPACKATNSTERQSVHRQ